MTDNNTRQCEMTIKLDSTRGRLRTGGNERHTEKPNKQGSRGRLRYEYRTRSVVATATEPQGATQLGSVYLKKIIFDVVGSTNRCKAEVVL